MGYFKSTLPLSQQHRALGELLRAFYVFTTVVVFFAVLGFIYIVYFYNAFTFHSDNGSNNNTITTNGDMGSVKLVRPAISMREHTISTKTISGSIVKQEGGMSGIIPNTHTAVWLFHSTQINTSSTVSSEYATITKHNVIFVVNANSEGVVTSAAHYVDIIKDDMYVTCLVGVSDGVLVFYTDSGRKTHGIGKLLNINTAGGAMTYITISNDNGNDDNNNNININMLRGHVTMGVVRRDHMVLYYTRGLEIVLASVPLESYKLLRNEQITSTMMSQQFWSSQHNTFSVTYNKASPVVLHNNGGSDGSDDVICDIAWNKYLAQYVILAIQSNYVEIWCSSTPHGPFTHHAQLTLSSSDKITRTYFHIELWRDDGRIMVFTYCTEGGGLPQFAEIEFCNQGKTQT